MIKIATFVCLVTLFSCKKNNAIETLNFKFKPNTCVTLNADNSLSLIDIDNLKVTETINLSISNSIYANQLLVGNDSTNLIMALPQFDFTQEHSLLHNISPLGGIGVFSISQKKITSQITVPFANFNVVEANGGFWTMAFSHTGKIFNYDKESGALLKTLNTNADPSMIQISKSKKLAIMVAGESTFASIIDLSTKTSTIDVKIDPFPSFIRPGFNDVTFIIENQNRKSINILDIEQQKVIDYIDLDFIPLYAIARPNSNEIWISAKDQAIICVYTKTNNLWTKIKTIDTEMGIVDMDFQSNTLIITNQTLNQLKFYDLTYNIWLKTIAVGNKPNSTIIWK